MRRSLDSGCCVCIFAKPPLAGEVKTRLAESLGPENAAHLAHQFLLDTWASVRLLRWAHPILASTGRFAPSLRPARAEVWLQGQGDLGNRLERILRRALRSHSQAIAIGADTPGLPTGFLTRARRELSNGADAVIGPTEDGGFYLLGLTRCPRRLLKNVAWGSSSVFSQTMGCLKEKGMRIAVLDAWFDVDRIDDLQRLRKLIARRAVRAPRTERALGLGHGLNANIDERLRLSVIIPVLNEEKAIEACLRRLRTCVPDAEVIVVDGASADRTVELARQFREVQVLEAARGRAHQMNTGAQVATGNVLLFLHADVELPPQGSRLIARALMQPSVVGGAFRTWTVSEGRSPLKFFLHLADLRSRYSRLPYGDQAIFVRKEIFQRLQGFPEQPLMEDLAFSKRLRALGRVEILPASVRVSGRRFLAHPIRYFALTNIFPLLYRFGVSPHRMARWYGNPR